jgi:hypothetical protein
LQSENKAEGASYPTDHLLYKVTIAQIERASKEGKDWEKVEKDILEREKKTVRLTSWQQPRGSLHIFFSRLCGRKWPSQ